MHGLMNLLEAPERKAKVDLAVLKSANITLYSAQDCRVNTAHKDVICGERCTSLTLTCDE